MKRIIQTGWLLATLGIVISCSDLDKSSNNNTKTEQSTPRLTNVVSINNSPQAPPINDIFAKAFFK